VIFSNADVIRRVNADFVPVALKAGLVNNPPDNDEGRLYREIGRSKILPQGICVVNSAGKVLDWVFMFDDDKSVLAFLDRARKRFAKFPDAIKPFPAERYMKFPSQKLADIEDNGKVVPIVGRHPEGGKLSGQATRPVGDHHRPGIWPGARQGRKARGRHGAPGKLCRGPLQRARERSTPPSPLALTSPGSPLGKAERAQSANE